MHTPYVLSIEDNKNDIVLMKRIFEKDMPHIPVTFIEDGESAIETFQSQNFKTNLPKVVIMDIKIPKRTGLEVLKFFREDSTYNNIPVIMLSSSDRADEIAESYRLGANSYLEKPKDFLNLKTKLNLIVEYWINTNRS